MKNIDGITFLLMLNLFITLGLSSCTDNDDASKKTSNEQATQIETNNGDASRPQVATDASGSAVSVWVQSSGETGTRKDVWTNRYKPGRGWGSETLLETDDVGNASNPKIAVNNIGDAIAVWQQSDGIHWKIAAANYLPGTGWLAAQIINNDSPENAEFPQVSIDHRGNAVAVWEQSDGNIWSSRFVVDTGWGAAEIINTNNGTGAASFPQVGIDDSGNVIAVWRQYDDAQLNRVGTNRLQADVGWGNAQFIDNEFAVDAQNPQISVNSSGNAIAVWVQNHGSTPSVWANSYTSGGNWDTADLIETNNAGYAGSPNVAIDDGGNATVVWYQFDGTHDDIWANHFVAGIGWNLAVLVENNIGDAQAPQVATDISGNAVTVWNQFGGMRHNIWMNSYTMQDGWAAATIIDSENAGDALNPQLSINNGGVIIVWDQFDGTRKNIWSFLFEYL